MTKTAPFATCWQILPLVSRSFAMVIRWLPRGLDDAVMVSYLLCRIADTLEDSVRDVAEKRRQLARFAETLDEGRPEIPLDAFPATYLCLMTKTDDVLAAYRALSAPVRTIIRARVQEMCQGMSKWADRPIVTFADQNEYCYYVAGLVGLMLTDLFHATGNVSDRDRAQLTPLAVDFGLALQKVNILRDLREDLQEDRCYWPSEVMARHGVTEETILSPEKVDASLAVMADMVEEHWDYLETALRYLTMLPMAQFRLRIFCAIPLFMAVATVRRCEGNPAVFLGPKPVKIPRRQARAILVRSLSLGTCNNYLQSWYRRWQRGPLERPSPFHAVASLIP
ncbi:MAG TPA: phytoene/squalene synthase family protein [Planctomycetota bacterium]|nr:phytoene/squalene synthase family protein [Planctomycetota bacterium]